MVCVRASGDIEPSANKRLNAIFLYLLYLALTNLKHCLIIKMANSVILKRSSLVGSPPWVAYKFKIGFGRNATDIDDVQLYDWHRSPTLPLSAGGASLGFIVRVQLQCCPPSEALLALDYSW